MLMKQTCGYSGFNFAIIMFLFVNEVMEARVLIIVKGVRINWLVDAVRAQSYNHYQDAIYAFHSAA